MPSGNTPDSSPGVADTPPELAAALWLILPVTRDIEIAQAICRDAALLPSAIDVKQICNNSAAVIAGQSSSLVRERIRTLPLGPAQLRAIAEQLSGVLLGASYADPLSLRLIELRDVLDLQTADCLYLTSVVWPQVTISGQWGQWLEALRPFADQTLPPLLMLSLLGWLGTSARWLGDFDGAHKWIEQALQLANREQDTRSYARFLLESGSLQRMRGRLLSAESVVNFARSQFALLDDVSGINRCNIELAQIALEQDEPARARSCLAGAPDSAQTRVLHAEAHLISGNHGEAITMLQEIVAAWSNSRPNLGRAYALLGKAYMQAHKWELAGNAITQALGILEATDDRPGYARTLSLHGELFLAMQDFMPAVDALEQAHTHQQSMRDDAGLRLTLCLLLQAYPYLIEQTLQRGALAEAEEYTARLIVHNQSFTLLPVAAERQ